MGDRAADSHPPHHRRRSLFRPCLDLHDGKVKQIVGGTLTDSGKTLATNFVSQYVPDSLALLPCLLDAVFLCAPRVLSRRVCVEFREHIPPSRQE